MSVVPVPANIAYLQEFFEIINTAYLRPALIAPNTYTYWHYTDTIQVVPGSPEHYSSIHEAGGNLIFLDGHAEYRKGLNLKSGDFGLIPANDTWTTTFTQNYQGAF